MPQKTTTTTPRKVAKAKLSPPTPVSHRRQLPWPRAELAATVKDLTGEDLGHDYLSDLARGIRRNARLAPTIAKATEILNKRHSIRI